MTKLGEYYLVLRLKPQGNHGFQEYGTHGSEALRDAYKQASPRCPLSLCVVKFCSISIQYCTLSLKFKISNIRNLHSVTVNPLYILF